MDTLTARPWRFPNVWKYLCAAVTRSYDDQRSSSVIEGRSSHRQGPQQTYWPTIADLRYFDSELRIAFLCVQLARSGPATNVRACAARTKEIYTSLSGWIHANGGHAGCERHLQQLRWHIAQLPHGSDTDQSDRIVGATAEGERKAAITALASPGAQEGAAPMDPQQT